MYTVIHVIIIIQADLFSLCVYCFALRKTPHHGQICLSFRATLLILYQRNSNPGPSKPIGFLEYRPYQAHRWARPQLIRPIQSITNADHLPKSTVSCREGPSLATTATFLVERAPSLTDSASLLFRTRTWRHAEDVRLLR